MPNRIIRFCLGVGRDSSATSTSSDSRSLSCKREMNSSRVADWKQIQSDRLIVCRVPNKGFRRYGQLAVIRSVAYQTQFKVFWTNGDQSTDIDWYDPKNFEIIDTETATPGNWKKGTRVLCVFGNHHKWLTGTVDEDYQRGNPLRFIWDKDPKTIEDDYGELSSFLVFQQPIEDAPKTLPTGVIPTSGPKELLTKPFVSEPRIDWDAYHGFKKGPYIVRE
jgi:hypothetical protein